MNEWPIVEIHIASDGGRLVRMGVAQDPVTGGRVKHGLGYVGERLLLGERCAHTMWVRPRPRARAVMIEPDDYCLVLPEDTSQVKIWHLNRWDNGKKRGAWADLGIPEVAA